MSITSFISVLPRAKCTIFKASGLNKDLVNLIDMLMSKSVATFSLSFAISVLRGLCTVDDELNDLNQLDSSSIDLNLRK